MIASVISLIRLLEYTASMGVYFFSKKTILLSGIILGLIAPDVVKADNSISIPVTPWMDEQRSEPTKVAPVPLQPISLNDLGGLPGIW